MVKTTKKILSLVLAVLMFVSVVPMTDMGIEASAVSYLPVNGHTVIDTITFNGVTTQAVYTTYFDGYYEDTTYSCAAFVKRFYANSYKINVWNLLYQQTPTTDNGSFSATSSPKVGDIVRRNSKTHWMIVKVVNGSTVTLIEQNWWTSPHAQAPVNRTISTTDSDYTFFRYSKATNGGSTDALPIGHTDEVKGGAGTVYVRGWAFDSDKISSALNIHVYIGDERHDYIYANKQRTDVNKEYGCGDYHGFEETITTNKTGSQTVKIYAINHTGSGNSLLYTGTVNITAAPSYYIDVNMFIDGKTYGGGTDGFSFDFYVNGKQTDNDAKDCWRSIRKGSTYEIKDIKYPSDYIFTGGETSGTVTGEKVITLNFAKTFYLDVNTVVNGVSKDNGVSNFTYDVYTNGKLNKNDVYDYYSALPRGTTFEIKDIKCPSGYKFTGGTTKGTVNDKTTVTLYFECTHPSTEIRNAKSATCTATGYTGDTYCKTCGAKTKTGSSIAKLSHSYSSTVTTSPTCTKEGVRTYTCSCGASYTEAIAKTAHNSNTKIPAVSATCTKTGLTEGKKCSVCGTVTVAQQTVAKLAHSYNSTVTTPATCTKEGIRTYKCSCGASYTEAIAKAAHSYNYSIGEQPDIDKAVKTYKCSCGDTYTDVAAVKAYSVVYKGTTYAIYDGLMTYADAKAFCEKFGGYLVKITSQEENDVVAELVEAFGNVSWINGTDETEEDIWKFDDGEEMPYFNWGEGEPNSYQGNEQDYLAINTNGKWDDYHGRAYAFVCEFPHEHSYSSEVTKKATCSTEGIRNFLCACGDTYTEEIALDATNHEGGTEIRNAVEGNCGEAGYTGDTYCLGCNTKIADGKEIPATGYHTYGKWVVDETDTKKMSRTCTVCGGVEESAVYLAGRSLLFKDIIQIRYYFDFSRFGDDVKSTGLLIWSEDEYKATDVHDINTAPYRMTNMTKRGNSDMYYGESAGVPAKNMIDNQYAIAYAELKDGTIEYTETCTFSPVVYCQTILAEGGNFEATMKNLAAALMNYGTAAQLHFKYKTDTLMNAWMADDLKEVAFDEALIQALPEIDDSKFTLTNDENIRKIGSSLTFVGNIMQNMYFDIENDDIANAREVKLLYWTESEYNKLDSLSYANARKADLVYDETNSNKTGINCYRTVLEGVSAKDLRGAFMFAVYYKDAEGNEFYGPLFADGAHDYVRRVLITNTAATMKNLAKAFFMYHIAAEKHLLK